MKGIRFLAGMIMMAAAMASGFAEGQRETDSPDGRGYGQGNGQGGGQGNGQGRGAGYGGRNAGSGAGTEIDAQFQAQLDAILANIEPGELTASERDSLLAMVDEEKLAQDVYAKLFSVWNLPVFNNIGGSETQHMDSLVVMLDRYGLKDGISTLPAGQFSSPETKSLYDRLVKDGSASLGAALAVGASIEDLDIRDLQDAIAGTDNDDLKIVYQNLMKGSRNHVRTFAGQIERQGGDYAPQYVSASYYGKILRINREIAVIDEPDYTF